MEASIVRTFCQRWLRLSGPLIRLGSPRNLSSCVNAPGSLLTNYTRSFVVPVAGLPKGPRKGDLRDFRRADPVDKLDPFEGKDMIQIDRVVESGLIPTLETHYQLFDGIRYKDLPIIHIKVSRNNSMLTVTTVEKRAPVFSTSCGKMGFKNTKKGTAVAAQATAMDCGLKAMKQGLKTVRVRIQGIGKGRTPCITGLQQTGINIVSITDYTPLIERGPRTKKPRRI